MPPPICRPCEFPMLGKGARVQNLQTRHVPCRIEAERCLPSFRLLLCLPRLCDDTLLWVPVCVALAPIVKRSSMVQLRLQQPLLQFM